MLAFFYYLFCNSTYLYYFCIVICEYMSEILIIILLILLNGVFAMAEISVISARRTRLSSDAKKGSRSADTALRLAEHPDKFLSTVQIGITLIGILTGIYSGATLADDFSEILQAQGIPTTYASPLAQGVIVIIVTYLSILFGELIPKRVGMSAAESVAKFMARPMSWLSTIAAPFVWILAKSTSGIFRLLGMKENDTKVTEDEIKTMIQEGTEDGEVQEVEQDIVERVFLMGDLKINSLMTYRADVVALDVNMSRDEVATVVGEHLYGMYPVIDRSFDDVKGVVSLKSLVFSLDKADFDLHTLITPAVFFHENMSVYNALEQMKVNHISRALVCDEFGSCQGVITLRDIMEGLVGNLDDSQENLDIVKRADSDGWLVDGRCSFYDFLCYFEKEELYEQGNYNTVSGLMLDVLEHIPTVGEIVHWGGFSLEVVDMDGVRIDKILVTIPAPSTPE